MPTRAVARARPCAPSRRRRTPASDHSHDEHEVVERMGQVGGVPQRDHGGTHLFDHLGLGEARDLQPGEGPDQRRDGVARRPGDGREEAVNSSTQSRPPTMNFQRSGESAATIGCHRLGYSTCQNCCTTT